MHIINNYSMERREHRRAVFYDRVMVVMVLSWIAFVAGLYVGMV